ncbi:uncharacterized protein LOC133931086 [Phragmites australis]|uniref:uncharacterized protein LOC133931086 n=1 Tax=Phragmites australis TaxID=29695 RepID=UPI002D7881A3|nr:uncharacterized protein LOC133931086 [Phragmites australis]
MEEEEAAAAVDNIAIYLRLPTPGKSDAVVVAGQGTAAASSTGARSTLAAARVSVMNRSALEPPAALNTVHTIALSSFSSSPPHGVACWDWDPSSTAAHVATAFASGTGPVHSIASLPPPNLAIASSHILWSHAESNEVGLTGTKNKLFHKNPLSQNLSEVLLFRTRCSLVNCSKEIFAAFNLANFPPGRAIK